MNHDRNRRARIAAGLLGCAAAAAVTGCASANRSGAQALATAGVSATGAISREVTARADRIGDQVVTQNFNYAYSTMRNCPQITTAGGAEPICDIVATAEERRNAAVSRQFAQLARVVRLRATAIDRLTAAYRALGAEADYDAQGQFETAINQATQGATELGAALGLGPVPEVAGTLLRIGGGQLAGRAQQRRLIAGSRRLQAIAMHLRASLAAEQRLHSALDVVSQTIERQARMNLASSGLLAPLPPLKEVVAASGFPSPGDGALQQALSRDQRLAAAASVAGLAERPAAPDTALAASIAVLDALIAEHRDFEANRGLSLADLTTSIANLTEIVDAAEHDFGHDEDGNNNNKDGNAAPAAPGGN